MADYVDSLLATGETVQLRAKQHWVALIRFALQPILILVGAVVVWAFGNWFNPDGILDIVNTLITWLAVGLFLVAIVWLPVQVVRWLQRRYVVTNRRVIESSGLFRRSSADAQLDKINEVGYQQSFLGRQMGFGDLMIETASGSPMKLDEIIGAMDFKKAIMEAQEALVRERAGQMAGAMGAAGAAAAAAPAPVATAAAAPVVAAAPAVAPAQTAAPAPPAPPAPTSDEITETLARLADLRDKGAITPEEYEAKKQELLARL